MPPRDQTADPPSRRVSFRALVLAGCALVHAASAQADAVRLLCGDHEAAQARVELIAAAQREINVAYFAIADDEVGRGFLALFRDAAQRGVAVRLIVDGLNNHIPPSIQRHLIASGVQLREYHPFTCSRPLWTNRRLHDKLLIVDCDQLILGSRNLDNRNFGLACRKFIDTDAYVRGCAAREAREYFLCLWRSEEVRPVETSSGGLGCLCGPLGKDDGPACARCALERAADSLAERGLISACASDCVVAENEEASVYFLNDDCGRKHQPEGIADKLLEALTLAEDSIVLESPYLVFSHRLESVLLEARQRGVRVVILTNSLSSTNQLFVYAAYANQRRKMLRYGVELHEFAGPDRLHAKTLLIDGTVCAIGSYNFDPRSEDLNTETAIMTDDPCVVDALISSMAEHFSGAWQIGPDGKPLGAQERHPGVNFVELGKLRAARMVAPLIKRHL